jgi:hypothetical protein
MAAKNRLTAKTVAHPTLLPARGEKEERAADSIQARHHGKPRDLVILVGL